jgi:hypothetical protein
MSHSLQDSSALFGVPFLRAFRSPFPLRRRRFEVQSIFTPKLRQVQGDVTRLAKSTATNPTLASPSRVQPGKQKLKKNVLRCGQLNAFVNATHCTTTSDMFCRKSPFWDATIPSLTFPFFSDILGPHISLTETNCRRKFNAAPDPVAYPISSAQSMDATVRET